ncbi:MAG: site-specific DNA-methyltransferase, partial [Verrucomicrobiota bacterium]
MSKNAEKFQALLRKLFQFDCAELDFGIYRIMNQKRAVVEQFIEKDLLDGVAKALGTGAVKDEADLRRQFDELANKIHEEFDDEDEGTSALDAEGNLAAQFHKTKTGKKYLDLQSRLRGARSAPELEAEIFNHLYTFFSRYYDEGDFMSLRRYSKRDKYAIPYNGEEVHLHWANSDQYYIKTGENFTDYSYRLAVKDGWTVRFKLRNADVEQNNVKGAKRFFIPRAVDVALDPATRTLTVPFDYRPLTKEEEAQFPGNGLQEKILKEASPGIVAAAKSVPDALAALTQEKRKDADGNPVSLLDHHLRTYTRKNTSDFFIHKDLGGFLERELDFYLKNEVLNLDELEAGGEPRAAGWFQMLRAIKAIGRKIIAFVAQIENFQKRLFEKKKFVTEVHYCVTLDRVPLELYPEIIKNKAQIEEWKRLFYIEGIEGDTTQPGFSVPLKVGFLQAQQSLVLDTKFFSAEFTTRLLESKEFLSGPKFLDDALDGLIVHGENLQALNLLETKFRGLVKTVYIDPPYNTGSGDFCYKDSYQHSSWLAMMHPRLKLAQSLLASGGACFTSIDDNEYVHLEQLQATTFGSRPEANIVRVNPSTKSWSQFLSATHDYCIVSIKDPDTVSAAQKWQIKKPYIDEFKKRTKALLKMKLTDDERRQNLRELVKIPMFKAFDHYTEFDEKGVYRSGNPNRTLQSDGAKVFPDSVLIHPGTRKKCKLSSNWRFDQAKTDEIAARKPTGFHFGPNETTVPGIKNYLDEYENMTPQTVMFDDTQVDTKTILPGMGLNFDFPKPLSFVRRILEMAAPPSSWCLDFFGGSGTTGHAVIDLNQEDKGGRKYLLIEMGNHFEAVLKPRLQKLAYSKDWKDGKPVSRQGSSHAFKYLRLESFEDALDNISFQPADGEAGQSLLGLENYVLGYMLDFETRESETLLNVAKLDAPFDYTLRRHGKDEPQPVDLPETFNYLIGLHVESRRA